MTSNRSRMAWACVAVVALVCAAASHASAARVAGWSFGSDLQRLTLPAFPLPPKRDFAMLGVRAPDADADADADADGVQIAEEEFEPPRFRAALTVADADADADADAEAESESDENGVETDVEVAETEAEAEADDSDSDSETEGEVGARAPAAPEQMRFARAMQRRYDTNALPPGALPVQPSTLQYDLARMPVAAVGDSLFMPIHHSERQFQGAEPVANSAANPNAYAWAGARLQPNYVYGNTLLGAPVNAQFYPPQPAAAPMPFAPMPFAPAAPTAPAAPAPAAAAATSFVQTQASAYAGARTRWPSSIARPATYYLPPDLVI